VNVVSRDLARDNLQLVFGGYLPDQVARTKSDLPRQHVLSIFRDPHELHLEVALRPSPKGTLKNHFIIGTITVPITGLVALCLYHGTKR